MWPSEGEQVLVIDVGDPQDAVASLARAMSFRRREWDPLLKDRPPDVFVRAIEQNQSYFMEIPGSGPDPHGDRLCASWFGFDHGQDKLTEMGAALVARAHRGVSLQEALGRVACLHRIATTVEALADPEWSIFGIAAQDNLGSIRNLQKIGFVRDSPRPLEAAAIGYDAAALAAASKHFYRYPPQEAIVTAGSLRALCGRGFVWGKPGVRMMTMTFGKRLRWFNELEFYDDVEAEIKKVLKALL